MRAAALRLGSGGNWTRVRQAAAPIAALLLFASCGGGPESEVKDTVKSYGKALAEGDGRTACGLVTDGFRDQIAEATGGRSCEDAVEAQASQLTPDQRDALHIKLRRHAVRQQCGQHHRRP